MRILAIVVPVLVGIGCFPTANKEPSTFPNDTVIPIASTPSARELTMPTKNDPAILCLEEQAHYLEAVPTDIKIFAVRMAEAIVHCHASHEQMKLYVGKIVAKHGDYKSLKY